MKLLSSSVLPIIAAILFRGATADHDCGNPHPTKEDDASGVANEIAVFGKPGSDMTRAELTAMVKSAAASRAKIGHKGNPNFLRRNLQTNPAWTLVDVPIVYHVLTQQHIPKANATLDAVRPSATAAQIEFMTNMTNKLYNIYDKNSQTSVQWASFVTDQVIYHNDLIINGDCDNALSSSNYNSIIQDATDWQFKLHAIICESTQWSGVASFPNNYAETSVLHNMVRIEYRAVACYNEAGDFLCDLTNGQQVSHTRWWRTRSTVLAHEFG